LKIGFTYDLKDDYLKMGYSEEEAAEFDSLETIEGIENALKNLGHEVERIGSVKTLAQALVEGKKWDLVFNIAEGMFGIGREAQVPAILDAYTIPYVFSDPLVLSLTLHKGLTKQVIRDSGIATAKFAVAENESDIDKINLKYPLFVKPVSEGTGKGITADSKVTTIEQLKEKSLHLVKKHSQPVIIEEFLPGREFTVGITGTGDESIVVGVMEVQFTEKAEKEAYGLFNKKNYKEIINYTIPEKEIYDKCANTALNAWKVLGCRDGGRVDLRNDAEGIPNFIEVNPLAGLHPIDSDLPILARLHGICFQTLIKEIMDSAIKRIEQSKQQ